MKNIPMLDLGPEVEELLPSLLDAFESVVRNGQFIMGPNVLELEKELATYLGAKHAVAVNSGTDALVIALRALNIGSGDEVITTPFTFFATAEAISSVGAKPVFVDIDKDTLNIDVKQLPQAVTARTKAVIPVHLFGQPVDMNELLAFCENRSIAVVEDCAQSFGARYGDRYTGTLGVVGCFSFFPSKNLGAYGDGGMILTNDDDVAEQAKMLRAHGSKKKYHNEVIGYNSRLDEVQAAILRIKLPHIERYNMLRAQAAARYDEMLAQLENVTPLMTGSNRIHVYHQYTVRITNGKRDDVKKSMQEIGISTMVYYPIPVHKLPVYSGDVDQSFPNAELAAQQVLSLPIWPQISPSQQREVVDALARSIRNV